MQLRDYQLEDLYKMEKVGPGRWIIVWAPGLGKTVLFTEFAKRQVDLGARVLICVSGIKLVYQPLKYLEGYDVEIEQADRKAGFAPIIIASLDSIKDRLENFDPEEFDILIIDEAHRIPAEGNRKVVEYFKPTHTFGFTATPTRSDGIGLEEFFDDIISIRDIRWGVRHKRLCDVECRRVKTGVDLNEVSISKTGEFSERQLQKVMNTDTANTLIVEAARKEARGPTLIFASGVSHARELADLLGDEAEVVVGSTKLEERAEIEERFQSGETKYICSVKVYAEGTDLPCISTIIMAVVVRSEPTYQQMVGRGFRLHEGKDDLLLIDCVGTCDHSFCTAASLIGFDPSILDQESQSLAEGDLFGEVVPMLSLAADMPENWIMNVEHVNVWAKKQKLKLHDVRYFMAVDQSLYVAISDGRCIRILPQDVMGRSRIVFIDRKHRTKRATRVMPMQACLDGAFKSLTTHAKDDKQLWSRSAWRRWGKHEASEAQLRLISQVLKRDPQTLGKEPGALTKGEACLIITRMYAGKSADDILTEVEVEEGDVIQNAMEQEERVPNKEIRTDESWYGLDDPD